MSADRLLIGFEEIASAVRALTPTKRSIVSLVGQFDDPIGYLALVVIQFKIFLHELCRAKIDWDEAVPADLMDRWSTLSATLQYAQPLSVPRCYLDGVPGEPVSVTLCGFCDASQKAYAGVIYLLLETNSGYTVKFVAAKTCLAPLQSQTVPLLELLAAVLLSHLLSTVTQSLGSENGVNEISKLTTPDNWNHGPGKENPADIPSRGLTPLELSVCTLWHYGPPWLGEDAADNPTGEETELTEECLAELRGRDQQPTHGLLTVEPAASLSQIMSCEKFGILQCLIATTARVLEFCRRLLVKIRADHTVNLSNTRLEAQRLWILECQRMVGTNKNFMHWCTGADSSTSLKTRLGCGDARGGSRMLQFPTKRSIPSYFS